jgi:hypothetical protein
MFQKMAATLIMNLISQLKQYQQLRMDEDADRSMANSTGGGSRPGKIDEHEGFHSR